MTIRFDGITRPTWAFQYCQIHTISLDTAGSPAFLDAVGTVFAIWPGMENRIRILHVEDNEFDVELFKLLLASIRSAAFVIDDARNIKEALSTLQAGMYNLILLDLKLPDSSGLDTFLKIHEAFPNIPVVVLSGEDNEKTALAAVALGAQDYLTKVNINAKTLVSAITYAMERHRRLSLTESQRDELLRTIDQLTWGVLLVDSSGKILRMNRSANVILQEQNGLYEQKGYLRATLPDESRALQGLFSSNPGQRKGAEQKESRHMNITRKGFAKPLSVLVTALESPDDTLKGAAAAVFVTNPDRDLENIDSIIQQRYSLTRAEAKLAYFILQGYGADEAAKELNLSYHTVRTHLKHIYQKTGTTRQSDLVRLVLTGPVFLAKNGPETQ